MAAARALLKEGWRRPDLIAGIVIVAIWALFHVGVLSGEVYYFRDLYSYYHPGQTVAAWARSLDEPPLWNPFVAFGQPLSKQQSVREAIATLACEIEQARLLTLKAADRMDKGGHKAAKDLIAMIKIVAPNMACAVIDRAIQIHGGAGVCQDFFLANAYTVARAIRLADGPDQVHMMQLGRNLAAATTAELDGKSY